MAENEAKAKIDAESSEGSKITAATTSSSIAGINTYEVEMPKSK